MSRKFIYETLIRESHLDTFGHVNNAVYLELFEQARWEMLTAGGLGLPEVQRLRRGPVVLDVHLRLKRELRLREPIRIETHLAYARRRLFGLRQEIYNASGECCSAADFTFGILDLDARRLVTPDERWQRALGIEPGVNGMDSASTS